jgi:PAS domain-containing protein
MLNALSSITRVLDALPCGAMLINRQGTIVYANRRIDELHGRPLRETGLADLYAGTEIAATVLGELARFEEPREVETFLPVADGSRRTVMVNGAPLGSDETLADYRLVTLTDVTPIRQARRTCGRSTASSLRSATRSSTRRWT